MKPEVLTTRVVEVELLHQVSSSAVREGRRHNEPQVCRAEEPAEDTWWTGEELLLLKGN